MPTLSCHENILSPTNEMQFTDRISLLRYIRNKDANRLDVVHYITFLLLCLLMRRTRQVQGKTEAGQIGRLGVACVPVGFQGEEEGRSEHSRGKTCQAAVAT